MTRMGSTRIAAFNHAAMRVARESKGWSQARLAIEIGLAPSTISAWERGSNGPEPPRFVQLAQALGVQPSDLLTVNRAEWTPFEVRAVVGLQQREAARRLAISPSRLSSLELGIEAMNPDIAARIADLYKVTEAELLTAWARARARFMEQ